jgi:hypothetical protein
MATSADESNIVAAGPSGEARQRTPASAQDPLETAGVPEPSTAENPNPQESSTPDRRHPLEHPAVTNLFREILRGRTPDDTSTAYKPKKSGLKVREPDPYYGRNIKEYYEWTRHAERYFAAKARENDIDEPTKVYFAATFLKGELESKWERHITQVSPDEMTWLDFKQWLQDQLEDPVHRRWTSVQKLEGLRQLPNQSVSSFATLFNDIRAQAAPELDNQEGYWMRMLFAKLRPELRKEISKWPTMPTRLVDLEAAAERLERQERRPARDNPAKPPTDPRPQGTSNQEAGKNATSTSNQPPKRKNESESYSTNKRQKTQGQGDKDKAKGTCFNCGKPGHYARNCRSKTKGTSGDSKPTETVSSSTSRSE